MEERKKENEENEERGSRVRGVSSRSEMVRPKEKKGSRVVSHLSSLELRI